jgi:hypothetical protein
MERDSIKPSLSKSGQLLYPATEALGRMTAEGLPSDWQHYFRVPKHHSESILKFGSRQGITSNPGLAVHWRRGDPTTPDQWPATESAAL